MTLLVVILISFIIFFLYFFCLLCDTVCIIYFLFALFESFSVKKRKCYLFICFISCNLCHNSVTVSAMNSELSRVPQNNLGNITKVNINSNICSSMSDSGNLKPVQTVAV